MLARTRSLRLDRSRHETIIEALRGDAFIGGFAAKLLEFSSLLSDVQQQAAELQKAVRYGCACGALATTKLGAQPSLPTKEEVEKFII